MPFGPRLLLAPFNTSLARGFALFVSPRGESGGDPGPQSVTNAQKLALSPTTAVGTQVSVSDGFTASGFGDSRDGFYVYDSNFGAAFRRAPNDDIGDGPSYFQWNGVDTWNYYDNQTNSYTSTGGDDSGPWTADWTGTPVAAVTYVHPAIQELAAPSTVQGGVFVSGGTQDGVYTARAASSYYSREFYNLLGQPDDQGNQGTGFAIWWDDGSGDFGHANSWNIVDGGPTALYYSLSDVATPDLVTNIAVPSNTAAFFKCDSLGVLYDFSGNANNFTVLGPTITEEGKHGLALDFSGISQTIESDTGTFSSGGSPFAVWMWVKRPVSSSNDVQWLARADTDFEIIWGAEADDKIYFGIPNSANAPNGTYISTASAVSSNDTWHLVMAWYDGTNWNLQIDNGTPVSGALGTPDGGDGSMILGGSRGGFTLFAGAMDSIGLRNATLSSGDRIALWNSGNGVDYGTNWKNASDDSPASISVTSVTQGELYAGLAVTNDGVTNGSSYVSQPFHGRQYYMGLNGGGSNNMHWDTDFNVWTDDVGEWTADNVAFPWQGTDAHSSHNGATFTRNDVANEANWTTA